MTSSRIPAALTALVAVLSAATSADVEVLRGRQLETAGDEGRRVYVGWSGEDTDRVAVEFTQRYAGLGAGRKAEEFSVRCCLVCWSGDDDPDALAALEAAAFGILADVEAAIRGQLRNTDGSGPLGLPLPATVGLAAGRLVYDSVQRVRIPCTVNITTRI